MIDASLSLCTLMWPKSVHDDKLVLIFWMTSAYQANIVVRLLRMITNSYAWSCDWRPGDLYQCES